MSRSSRSRASPSTPTTASSKSSSARSSSPELPRGWTGDAVEELGDGRRRERADELVDDTAFAERLHGRDPLDAVALRKLLVGVDVDLRENDLALAGIGLALEDRPEHPARSAPLRPEVHDDGKLARARQHLLFESLGCDVHRQVVARSTTAAKLRFTSSATGPSSSLSTIESIRAGSIAAMHVSPSRS